MTEYDAHDMYQKQIEKDKVSAIEGNNGKITYHFKDGTVEIWKGINEVDYTRHRREPSTIDESFCKGSR